MKSYALVFGVIFAAAVIISVASKSNANPGGGGKIVDGTDARPGEFPWQVSIQFYLNESISSSEEWEPRWVHKCGGTIIDHRHVLTAAHCTSLSWPEWLQKTRIVFGAWNRSDETESSRLVRKPCHYSIHPNYSMHDGAINMDITVVTWKKPITYTKYIQPLRLAAANADPLGTVCVISGWGIEHEEDKELFSEILKVANQTIIGNEECAQRMNGSSPTGRPILETDICGVDITGGNQTACSGDSGSPLVCYDADGPYLAGVHSYGACHMPHNITETVNIRVSKLLDFITCKRARKG